MEKGNVYWTQTQISSLEDFQYCFSFRREVVVKLPLLFTVVCKESESAPFSSVSWLTDSPHSHNPMPFAFSFLCPLLRSSLGPGGAHC